MSTGTGTIDIALLRGGRVNLAPEQLDLLDSPLTGQLLRAGDEGWGDAVLVWNGIVAMVPALGHNIAGTRSQKAA